MHDCASVQFLKACSSFPYPFALLTRARLGSPRVALYRGGAPITDVRGRIVLVVDDGCATGVSARAAMKALKVGAQGKTQEKKLHCTAERILG